MKSLTSRAVAGCRGAFVLAVAGLLAASCSSGGSAVSAGDEGSISVEAPTSDTSDLPVSLVFLTLPIVDSVESLSEATDAVVVGTFVGVEEGYRLVLDPEGDSLGTRAENVGLVFDVDEVLMGEVDSDRITIVWEGYLVDIETGDRIMRFQVGDFDITDPKLLGQKFIVPVVAVDGIGLGIATGEAFQYVGADDSLQPVMGSSLRSVGIDTVGDLREAAESLRR